MCVGAGKGICGGRRVKWDRRRVWGAGGIRVGHAGLWGTGKAGGCDRFANVRKQLGLKKHKGECYIGEHRRWRTGRSGGV